MQITVARLSEANKNERLDSQFFHPEYVASYNIVNSSNHSMLTDIAHITDGNHLKIASNFDDSHGVRYLRGQDLGTDMMLSDRNIVHIPVDCFDSLQRSHIFKNDVLITIVGANTGLVGLVYNPPEQLVANCKLGIVRPNIDKILSGYLYTFLIGRFGQHQILRSIRGGGQTGLVLPDMRKLLITRLSQKFEAEINKVVLFAHSNFIESKNLYRKAEDIVLSELNLNNWQPNHQLSFIKNYSDTLQAERMDAEYYQPKYEVIEEAIKNYSGGYSLIGNEFSQNKTTFKIDDEKLYQYVEIGSVNISNGEILPKKVLGAELPANAKRLLNKNDVVVSKVRPYRGAISIVEEHGCVGSGAFTVLEEKGEINKETLLSFLHSKPLLAWSLKPNTGTSYPVIVDDDILNLPVPLFPKELQVTIKSKITESSNLRKQSKHLLEYAKRAVEIAIEENEKVAISWLKERLQDLE